MGHFSIAMLNYRRVAIPALAFRIQVTISKHIGYITTYSSSYWQSIQYQPSSGFLTNSATLLQGLSLVVICLRTGRLYSVDGGLSQLLAKAQATLVWLSWQLDSKQTKALRTRVCYSSVRPFPSPSPVFKLFANSISKRNQQLATHCVNPDQPNSEAHPQTNWTNCPGSFYCSALRSKLDSDG